ncbi:MAG: restriction endonuclease subunit S [Elusimicrobia bacterium]|nr:restriction endonuclease subunit S [Elusimicrobiota bacterium]
MKPGYKKTEMGVIPADWDVKPLSSLAGKIMVGIASAATHAYRTKGVPMFRNQNIKAGYLDDGDLLYIDPEYEKTYRNKRLQGGDLLTARTGYPGTTCVVPSRYESAQSFTTLITRPNTAEIDSSFLCGYINSEAGQKFFDQGQIGGAQKNVNAGTLRKMPVPIPPSPEQRAIAEALSDVDGLLGGLDRLIAKKRDLKQAAMQQLLTAQTRLPGFHGKWEVKRLGDVALLKNGYAFKSDTYTSLGSFKIITIANVQDGYMTADACNTIASEPSDLQPHQRLRRGDILISMTGNVGRVCRVDEDRCLLNQRVGKLVPVGVVDALLFLLLGQPSFISAMTGVAKGGAQPNLSAPDITEHTFNIPRDATEQTAIAEVLSDMDAELAALESRRDKARALKQGMMQELLTGRTRLL